MGLLGIMGMSSPKARDGEGGEAGGPAPDPPSPGHVSYLPTQVLRAVLVSAYALFSCLPTRSSGICLRDFYALSGAVNGPIASTALAS